MKRRPLTLSPRQRALLACATLLWAGAVAPTAVAADAPAEPAAEQAETKPIQVADELLLEGGTNTYSNWATVSFGSFWREGSGGQFPRRLGQRQDPFGGLEDLHYEAKVGKDATFSLDGRALFDNHDYEVRVELIEPKTGFLRAGYKEYRAWYDGSGGFYPPNGRWYDLYPQPWHLDRGEIWFEGGLTIKDWPQFTFKYAHQFREGAEDSTSWGLAHPTGGTLVRGLSPSFYNLDQHIDIFQGDLKHRLLETDFGLGLRYETGKLDDARMLRLWPGEGAASDRYISHREGASFDLFNVHAFTETWIKEKVFFSTGFSFSDLDNDFSGSRIYGNDYDVNYNPALAQGMGFTSLNGGSQLREYTANINLMFCPLPKLTLVPSLKILKEEIAGISDGTETGLGLAPDGPYAARDNRHRLDVSERLELRYTGITNWVLYARGDWTEGEGKLLEQGGLGLTPPVARYTEDSRAWQKYTAGATWYPLRGLNLDIQYYHKSRDNDYDHLSDDTANSGVDRYPAYLVAQQFDTDDANLRLTLRPRRNVTLVSRYDFQYSTIQTQADPVSALGEAQTSKMVSHVVGENATWVPWQRLSLQGGFNYVWSQTATPASEYTQAVLDSQNNYWTASLTANFVLDNKTDLQAQYFFYRADNYVDNSAYGVPFGAGAREQSATIGLIRRLRENLRLNLKYGYFTYRDDSLGPYNNYKAHLVYSSLTMRF